MDVQAVTSYQAARFPPPGSLDATLTESVREPAPVQDDRTRPAAQGELALNGDIMVKVGPDEATGRNVVRTFTADGSRQISQFPPPGVLAMPQHLHAMREGPLLVSKVA